MSPDQSAPPSLGEFLRSPYPKGNVFAEQCPSREVLNHVTSRWGVLLLLGLRGGTFRFSELRRKVGGISEKMLAQTLQTLEADGFVERIAYPVVPPHVEYRLSASGEEVALRVEALTDWIEQNLATILSAPRPRSRLSALADSIRAGCCAWRAG